MYCLIFRMWYISPQLSHMQSFPSYSNDVLPLHNWVFFLNILGFCSKVLCTVHCSVVVVVVIKNLSISVTSCLISFWFKLCVCIVWSPTCSLKFSLLTQTKRECSNDALPSSTNVHAHIIDEKGYVSFLTRLFPLVISFVISEPEIFQKGFPPRVWTRYLCHGIPSAVIIAAVSTIWKGSAKWININT